MGQPINYLWSKPLADPTWQAGGVCTVGCFMDMVRVITTEEGSSIASLFEYSFISFSDCDISHICIHFRAENAIRLELVGGVDNGRCSGEVRTIV